MFLDVAEGGRESPVPPPDKVDFTKDVEEDINTNPEDNPSQFIAVLVKSLHKLRKIPEAAEVTVSFYAPWMKYPFATLLPKGNQWFEKASFSSSLQMYLKNACVACLGISGRKHFISTTVYCEFLASGNFGENVDMKVWGFFSLFLLFEGILMKIYSMVYFLLCLVLAISWRSHTHHYYFKDLSSAAFKSSYDWNTFESDVNPLKPYSTLHSVNMLSIIINKASEWFLSDIETHT